MRFGNSKILIAAMAAALITTGAAVAANDNGSGSKSANRAQGGPPPGGPHGGPGGGPGGPGAAARGRNLTYAEFHVQKNGKAVVYRTDAGKVKTISSDSITLTENDGNDVTIAIDDDTDVFGPPKDDGDGLDLSDIKTGDKVMVDRKAGEAADTIGLRPPKSHNK